jgi:hypothetical protein
MASSIQSAAERAILLLEPFKRRVNVSEFEVRPQCVDHIDIRVHGLRVSEPAAKPKLANDEVKRVIAAVGLVLR